MMKQIYRKLLALIPACLLLLTGCTAGENTISGEGTLEDLYYITHQSGQVVKIDLLTGESLPLCMDPLCDHGDGCFFSCVDFVCMDGNTVYFSRTDMDSLTPRNRNGEPEITESICSYDYDTGKLNVLCDIRSGRESSLQGMMEAADGYVWFYRRTPNPEVTEYSLYRVKTGGGTVEDMGLSVPMWHGAHADGRLYFYDNGSTLYSTDEYGQDRTDEVVLSSPGRIVIFRDTSDGFLYYTIQYQDRNEIWRKDLASNRHEKLYTIDSGMAASLTPTDGTLTFLISGEEVPFACFPDGRVVADPYGGKIYRLNPKTGKVKTVYDDPDTHLSCLRKSGNRIVVFTSVPGENSMETERFILSE